MCDMCLPLINQYYFNPLSLLSSIPIQLKTFKYCYLWLCFTANGVPTIAVSAAAVAGAILVCIIFLAVKCKSKRVILKFAQQLKCRGSLNE